MMIQVRDKRDGTFKNIDSSLYNQMPGMFDVAGQGTASGSGFPLGLTSQEGGSSPAQSQDPNKPLYPTLESFLKKTDAGDPRLARSLTLGDYNADAQGYGGLKNVALAAPGSGIWEKMMMGRLGAEQASARDAAVRQAASARAQGFSDLARRGGISRGAMGRVGRQSLLDEALQRQDVARQGQLQRFGIGSEAEKQRLGALSQFAGMEQAAKQFDIQNVIRQKQAEDLQKLGKYSEEMKAYAAGKQADATANSGKK